MATDQPPDPTPDDLLHRLSNRPKTDSRYKLEGEVARGGMGSIIKIWDEDLRRHLAMKVVLGKGEEHGGGSTPSVDSKQLARFLEEAQVTGQLDHPGIVPVHEVGLDSDGRVYFTMKLVKGRDLKHIFDLVFERNEDWNETRALNVIMKVCEAMAYAHAKGVIHRDLKPANVMVGSFGEVYVMDWGLSRVLGRNDKHDIRIKPEFTSSIKSVKTERRDAREDTPDSPIMTMDGDVMGTPAYMSPEQARGEIEKLGPHSDVYSIGAMLYHLLARQMPYVPAGEKITNRTVLARVLDGPPKVITSIRARVPSELVAIAEKAMSRNADLRYPDTLALAHDLRSYLEGRVVAAYETGTWAETRKWVRRNKQLAASIAAGMLLAVGGLTSVIVVKSNANTKLLASKNDALAKEARAVEQEGIANERAADLAIATRTAQDSERLATQKANDVLSLSAIQELRELEDDADRLWPAHPENVDAYEMWLAKARLLIDGRASDEGPGKPRHPSLKDHEGKLAELRLQAKPLTPKQIEDDRKASPSFAEWEKESAKLLWMRQMLGEEPWPSEAEVAAALAQEKVPADAQGLNVLARALVDTDEAEIVHGSEVRALVLARLAVAAANDAERAELRDTLAWALFGCGRFDESRAEEERAVAEIVAVKKKKYGGYLENLNKAIGRWTGDAARAQQSGTAAKLAERVLNLERDVNERRTYEFDDPEVRWWATQLSKLVSGLRAFTDEKSGGLFSTGTSKQHGWGILKRAGFARTVRERSTEGLDAKRRWAEAIAAIARSPKYSGLVATPQLGLLPIGSDPASGLWEFAHLQTGDVPERDADRKLVVTEGMGLVFVLIPSGTFAMGNQKTDPAGPNFDPQASSGKYLVHEVTLEAYFISKFEMTQGQWERFMGVKSNNDRQLLKLEPQSQVSWNDCMQMMGRIELELPTDTQWECAARGGTSSVWSTGNEKETLKGAANLSDSYRMSNGGPSNNSYEEWLDDGAATLARIGSYRANGYGLHDVHGNVMEWCRDRDSYYDMLTRTSDGEASGGDARVYRGGGYSSLASGARSAARFTNSPVFRTSNLGLRPARAFSLPTSLLHLPKK